MTRHEKLQVAQLIGNVVILVSLFYICGGQIDLLRVGRQRLVVEQQHLEATKAQTAALEKVEAELHRHNGNECE